MEKFEFDLEQARYELENIENLISVFWDFFSEGRPIGNPPDKCETFLFVQKSETYESVIITVWDKIRKIRADMETAIDRTCEKSRKGGEVA